MASKLELMKKAVEEMAKATYTPSQFCTKIDDKEDYNWMNTHNFKAMQYLWQASRATDPNPAPSPIDLTPVQRCLFLVDDISRALETNNRLLICTADLTYRHYYDSGFLMKAIAADRFRVWCDCHSTFPQTAWDWLNDLGLVGFSNNRDFSYYFYGECESSAAFKVGYDAGARKFVGNMSVLTANSDHVPNALTNQLALVDKGEVLVTNEVYLNRDPFYNIDWRNADGVGSNCRACYASSSEPATYYPFQDQPHRTPATDCYYVTGLQSNDWDFLVNT